MDLRSSLRERRAKHLFASASGYAAQVYVVRLADGEVVLSIPSAPGTHIIGWAPDGKRFAYEKNYQFMVATVP